MQRPGTIPAWLKAGLATLWLMHVGPTARRASADEPAPKADEAKKPDPAKKIEETAKVKDAVLKAAEKYIILIDQGKYGESWEASTQGFRNGLTRRKWVNALGMSRTPLGPLRGRKLNRIELRASEVAERIDQAWVYSDLRLATGEKLGELVILLLEPTKAWKPSGYYLGVAETLPKPPEEEKDEAEAKEQPRPADQSKAPRSATRGR